MLQFFCTHEWTWTNTNTISLWREITEGDRSDRVRPGQARSG